MSSIGFPRGPGPLVSVLYPTRGHPKQLAQAVDGLYSLAADKRSLEFVFKTDADDPATQMEVNRFATLGLAVTHLNSPRGLGYADMHHWVNWMAKSARGDWLIIWNDDVRVLTQNWDAVLMSVGMKDRWHGCLDVACLVAETVETPGSMGFFFLRRKVTQILGHFSRSPHNDTYVTTLMKMVDSLFFLGDALKVSHQPDEDDVVYREGAEARLSTKYTTTARGLARLKLLDALKLQDHIDADQARRDREAAA